MIFPGRLAVPAYSRTKRHAEEEVIDGRKKKEKTFSNPDRAQMFSEAVA